PLETLSRSWATAKTCKSGDPLLGQLRGGATRGPEDVPVLDAARLGVRCSGAGARRSGGRLGFALQKAVAGAGLPASRGTWGRPLERGRRPPEWLQLGLA